VSGRASGRWLHVVGRRHMYHSGSALHKVGMDVASVDWSDDTI
jgi:hypothetical protein